MRACDFSYRYSRRPWHGGPNEFTIKRRSDVEEREVYQAANSITKPYHNVNTTPLTVAGYSTLGFCDSSPICTASTVELLCPKISGGLGGATTCQSFESLSFKASPKQRTKNQQMESTERARRSHWGVQRYWKANYGGSIPDECENNHPGSERAKLPAT